MVHLLIGSYERDAIRPHVLGHFKDLLLATARHPGDAVLSRQLGVDGARRFRSRAVRSPARHLNGVPNSILPGPLAQLAHGLNENYGREVMELHTLGVKGGYTQDDVIAVARCFTGWTVRDPDQIRSSCSRPSCTISARRPCSATRSRRAAASRMAFR